jgi:glutathione S-transferase
MLVENIASQTYIARTHPTAQLMPANPEDEAGALSLMAFFASAVHPAFSHFYAPARFTQEASGEAGIKAKGLQTFFGHCREIDTLLAGRKWFLDQFSIVDSYGFVLYHRDLLAGLSMTDLPYYTAHKNRMLARPAVKRVPQGVKECSN